MAIAPGDVLRYVGQWDIPDGTIAQMVMHFLAGGSGTATEAAILAAITLQLETAWLHIDQDISNAVLGDTTELSKWNFTLNQWDGIISGVLVNADGTSVSALLAHGVAGLLKVFTVAARRQARKYVPGYTEASATNGTLLPAQITSLALFGADLDDQITSGTITLDYCTFNTDPLSPLFETTSIARNTAQAEGILAYQRRRRPGTGI